MSKISLSLRSLLLGIAVLVSTWVMGIQNTPQSAYFKDINKDNYQQRIDSLNALTKSLIGKNNDLARSWCDLARLKAEQFGYKKGLALANNHLGTIYYYSSNYTADTTYQFKALKLYLELGDQEGIARSYANIGLVLYAQSLYQEALEYHGKALEIRLKLGDVEAIADSYNSIGIVYFKQGNYSEAMQYHLNALKMRQQLGDPRAIANSNNNLGNVYKALKFYDRAIDYYNSALKSYEKVNDKLGIAISSYFVAGVYLDRNQNEKALTYYNRSLREYINQNNIYYQVLSYNYIGKAHENMGNNSLAREFYAKALVESEKIGNKSGIALSLNNIGALDCKEKRYNAAIASLKKAKELAQQGMMRDELSHAYYYLSEAYAALGDFRSAFQFHRSYSQVLDTLRSLDVAQITQKEVKAIADQKDHELQIGLEREKKQEAEVKKQKAIKYSFIIGSILLLGFLMVLFNRFRLIRIQKKIIEEEQKRSDELLLNILPADVAEELKSVGKAEAKSYKQVTVLFTDIQNFTKIGESLSPEQLVAEIDYYFKAFDSIVEKYGIEKIKTIGDAYMCAAGLHYKDQAGAVHMIQAALEMQAFIDQEKSKRQAEGRIFFEIRTGIHTGPVVAGIVGHKKFAYDIWGDAVNTASRMESTSITNRINISESTFDLVKDAFECTYRGKVEVKNKGMMDMYFVEGEIKSALLGDTRFDDMKRFVLGELQARLPKNLYYHGVHHTQDVISAAERLGQQHGLDTHEFHLLLVAALFHDSGFIFSYEDHEEMGCKFAQEVMPQFGYDPEFIDQTCELIRITKTPQQPQTLVAQLLCDADLDYLGREDYGYIAENLFNELKAYGHKLDENEWIAKQIDFLHKHRFFVNADPARIKTKQTNMERLKLLNV